MGLAVILYTVNFFENRPGLTVRGLDTNTLSPDCEAKSVGGRVAVWITLEKF